MIDASLLQLLPPLRRARGDRLYGAGQKHWVDLWKQDGAWLLGRRPEGAAREWKNQLDKGLAGWAPSHWPRRLEPLVQRLVPGVAAVRVFRNVDRCPIEALWRPWDDSDPATAPAGPVRLVLPVGPGQAVAVAYPLGWTSVPDHDVTSPAEAAGLVHAAAQVLRFTADLRAVAARARAAREFDLQLGTEVFVRHGVWFQALPGLDYASLFRAHLEAGFLLPPHRQAYGVIPTELSEGEWKNWRRAAEAWASGRS